MKKFLILILALSLGIGTIFVVGCSDDDDDTGTGPVTLPDGDPADPVFVEAMDPLMGASEMVPWGLEPLVGGMSYLIDSMAMRKIQSNQPDTIWYNADNNYWYGEGSGFDADFGMSYLTYDSMQFLNDGVAAQWPDTLTLTQINGGGWRLYTIVTADKEMAGDTGIYYSFVGSLVGAPGALDDYGDATANGSGHLYFFGVPGKNTAQLTCSYEIYDDFQSTNVQFNLYDMMVSGACPEGGTTVHNADITLDCTGDTTFTHADTWYLSETYASDTVDYVVENSNFHWEFSEECYIPR